MEKISSLLASIQEKMAILKTRYEEEVKAKEQQIDDNNQSIKDYSEQIDVIFAEIKKCEEETEKINIDFETITNKLTSVLDTNDEYNLLDKGSINQKIEEAEGKRNQFLSEIESTVTDLNQSLTDIRGYITDLDASNASLTDLIELLNATYTNLTTNVENSLENDVSNLTNDLESLLEDNKSATIKTEKPKVQKIKKEDLEQNRENRRNNLIDLEKFLEEKAKNKDDQLEDKQEVQDFDPPFLANNMSMVFGIAPAPDIEKTEMEFKPEDMFEEEPTIDVEEALKDFSDIELPTAEMFISRIEQEEPVAEEIKEEQTEEVTTEEPVMEEPVVEEPVVEETVIEPVSIVLEPIVETKEEPVIEEPKQEIELKPLVENEYIGLNNAGIDLERITQLKSLMPPIKYGQLTNILANYGIILDDLNAYFDEFVSVENPQNVDLVLNLLRGVGKTNDAGDLGFMLEHIFKANPEEVQDNLLKLYAQGQDPLPMPIQFLCSSHFGNLQALKEEGYNIDILSKQFPETICSLPLSEFKSYIEGPNAEKSVDGEQKVYGGKAA